MEAERDRHHGNDLEVGYIDIAADHSKTSRPAPHHAAPPAWLVRWEDTRPRLLTEMFAEALGVFFYTFCGVGAGAAAFVEAVEKGGLQGSLFTVGFAYGIGIVLAIIICGPASGGHINPCFTIAFWLFKGFPLRKVPFYIIAQIFGAFLGILSVYGAYHQPFKAITAEFAASPVTAALIHSPNGPAGVLALFPYTGQDLSYGFLSEFICCYLLAIGVFSVLDPSNLFISFSSAPFIIAIGYMALIWAYAPGSLALNTARDLGGRMACSAAGYGTGCWPARYTALASLTNILATQLGAATQILLLSDSARPMVSIPPDAEKVPSLRVISRGDGASLRAISKENNGLEKRSL